jgi:hypothetical protein
MERVALAVGYQAVEPFHPVLHLRELRVCGADVLDEEELAAGTEHAPELPGRPG